MAERSSNEWWDWDDEDVAQCSRARELGTEVGLREAGCSEEYIAKILRFLRKTDSFDTRSDAVKKICSIVKSKKNGSAVLLATLGRGISSGIRYMYVNGVSKIGRNKCEATALCVNLSSNTNIKKLKICNSQVFGSVQGCSLLATALRSNSAIQELYLWRCGIGSEALRCLMVGLHANKTLTKLVLEENPLSDEGIVAVADFLKTNPQLKVLNISSTESGYRGAHQMASALEHNETLEVLCFGEFCNVDEQCRILRLGGRDGMKRLLEPLSWTQTPNYASSFNGPKNTTLKRLAMRHTNMEGFCVQSLARMIRTNKTLSALKLDHVLLPPSDWQEQIIPALRENETLEELDLGQSQGLTNDICESLLDLIRCSASGLRTIELKETDIGNMQDRVDAALRFNLEQRDLWRSEAQVPIISGRLLLCGLDLKPSLEPCRHPSADQPASKASTRFSASCNKISTTRPFARYSSFLHFQRRRPP